MAEPILCLEGITLRDPEGRELFEGLDWRLARGERVRIGAAEGGGEDAFLRLCAGLAAPEAGRIWLDGVPLGPVDFSHPFLARGALAWIPSGGGLLVNQSLLANLALPLRFAQGVPTPEAEGLALAMLERVGLANQAGQRPHALEAQDRWLAALARAALGTPELWLVDEPPGEPDRRTARVAGALLETALADPEISAIFLGQGPWIPPGLRAWKLENGRILEDTP